jgi:hypothetical protein
LADVSIRDTKGHKCHVPLLIIALNRKEVCALPSTVQEPKTIKTYQSIIPVVLYGCENWCLILREESGLKVFENWVLTRLFGPKSGEVAGSWRRLHNEEHRNWYASPNVACEVKSRRMRWSGHVAGMRTNY